MRVIFLGKDKLTVYSALNYIIKKKFEVVGVAGLTKKLHVPLLTQNQLYKKQFTDIDLVISYLYPKKIKSSLIQLPKIGCLNFHPAPLPYFRGVCGYSFGIFEQVKTWGVSAHFVDRTFDTGDIIKVKTFPINQKQETAFSLEEKSQLVLLKLFEEVINIIQRRKSLPRIPQRQGRYFSKKMFENLRKIKKTDTLEIIDRKIRACWFPPYPGAYIKLGGGEFTLVNEKILSDIPKLSYDK